MSDSWSRWSLRPPFFRQQHNTSLVWSPYIYRARVADRQIVSCGGPLAQAWSLTQGTDLFDTWSVIRCNRNRGGNYSCMTHRGTMGSIQLTSRFVVLGRLEQHLITVGQEPTVSPALQPAKPGGSDAGPVQRVLPPLDQQPWVPVVHTDTQSPR